MRSSPAMRAAAAVVPLLRLLPLLSLWVFFPGFVTGTVTYDHRAIVINGQRRILISGSIHYPRSVPEVSMPVHLVLSPIPAVEFLPRC